MFQCCEHGFSSICNRRSSCLHVSSLNIHYFVVLSYYFVSALFFGCCVINILMDPDLSIKKITSDSVSLKLNSGLTVIIMAYGSPTARGDKKDKGGARKERKK